MAELLLLGYIAASMMIMNRARRQFHRKGARLLLSTTMVAVIFAAAWVYGIHKARKAIEPQYSIEILAE